MLFLVSHLNGRNKVTYDAIQITSNPNYLSRGQLKLLKTTTTTPEFAGEAKIRLFALKGGRPGSQYVLSCFFQHMISLPFEREKISDLYKSWGFTP